MFGIFFFQTGIYFESDLVENQKEDHVHRLVRLVYQVIMRQIQIHQFQLVQIILMQMIVLHRQRAHITGTFH